MKSEKKTSAQNNKTIFIPFYIYIQDIPREVKRKKKKSSEYLNNNDMMGREME
jgi:hypothetical protein